MGKSLIKETLWADLFSFSMYFIHTLGSPGSRSQTSCARKSITLLLTFCIQYVVSVLPMSRWPSDLLTSWMNPLSNLATDFCADSVIILLLGGNQYWTIEIFFSFQSFCQLNDTINPTHWRKWQPGFFLMATQWLAASAMTAMLSKVRYRVTIALLSIFKWSAFYFAHIFCCIIWTNVFNLHIFRREQRLNWPFFTVCWSG